MRKLSSAGFSLVEAVAAGAILSVAVLGFGLLSTSSLKVYKAADNKVGFNAIVTQVNSWIQNEETCRLAFGGPTTANAGTGGTLLGGVNEDPTTGVVKIQIFYPTTAKIPYISPTSLGPDPANVRSKWQFTDVTLTPMNGTAWIPGQINPAILTLNASSLNATDAGLSGDMRSTMRLAPTVRLSLALDGTNKILSCGPLTFNSYTMKRTTPGTAAIQESALSPIAKCEGDYASFSTGTSVICVKVKCPNGAASAVAGAANPVDTKSYCP